jgi:hypothetical protein
VVGEVIRLFLRMMREFCASACFLVYGLSDRHYGRITSSPFWKPYKLHKMLPISTQYVASVGAMKYLYDTNIFIYYLG